MATVNPSIHSNEDTASPVANKEKQALVAIRKLRKQLEEINYHQREPIAIVGLSCRFPGARDADAFWRLLDEGVDATREVPPERWDADEYYDPDPGVPGKAYTRLAGFLDEIDQFDPAFFGISPREAEFMDPQQRILLEQAWCALENAGIAPNSLQETRTGVFVGISACDYAMLIQEAGVDPGPYYITGNAFNAAAGRLAYTLKLQGPSVAIDTACSSSLVAAHQACASLRNRESDLALVAGVNLIISPMSMVATCGARMLSADGHCKTFDVSADGYARGEGCGVVVLKRLSDAQRDGDRIMAMITGSALSQDGRSSGFTVPNGASQQRAITDALHMANRAGKEVQYLEAHGTGTPLGDPIEIQAAAQALANDREGTAPLLVGSVKTNIGHLESAAGVASLIKVTLAMQHGRIPKQLHCNEPNPHIPWDELDLRVATDPVPWPAGDIRRIAGISAFGFSGTNAHFVLEEAPDDPITDRIPEHKAEDAQRLLVLSGRTPGVLKQLGADYLSWLDQNGEASLDDVCYTASTGRAHFEHRAAMVFSSSDRLREQLASLSTDDKAEGLIVGEVRSGKPKPRVGFLFTGQGAQYSGMGLKLYQTEKVYRECFDRCASEFARLHDSGPGLHEIAHEEKYEELLTQTVYVQPALYALQVSLTALWRSWGVVPVALLGHSAGDYAAACAAGVFSVEEGMRLIVERARLMQTLPSGGAMLTVTAPADALEAVLEGDDSVCVSAYQGLNTVISGPSERLDALMKEFEGRNLYCTKLPASNAFHSKYVEPILDDFEAYAREIEYAAPSGTLVSSMTGSTIDDLNAAYWRNHARQPVRFADAVRTLFETAVCDVVVELGPQAELMWLAQMCWRPEHEVLWASSLEKGRNASEQMLTTAAQLYANGTILDFRGMEGDSLMFRKKVSIPTYPFQRKRYWVDIPESTRERSGPKLADCVYRILWEQNNPGSPRPQTEGTASWLIVCDEGGTGTAMCRELEARDERYVCLDPAVQESLTTESLTEWIANAESELGEPFRFVVHLRSLDGVRADTLEELQQAQKWGVESVIRLVQALIRRNWEGRLWLVTRGVQQVLESDIVEPAQSTVWGLGKAVGMERPRLWGGLIDLPLEEGRAAEARELVSACECGDDEDNLALRDGHRWTARLVRDVRPVPAILDVDGVGTYLITGGIGDIGLNIARRLAERGARHLVLSSRSSESEAARVAIEEIQDKGCQVRVIPADVSREDDIVRLFKEMDQAALPPLKGLIHAAGVESIIALEEVSRDELYTTMAAKVFGGWLLNRFISERGIELSFFVCMSSISSVWGGARQASYAAGNAFLNALCESRAAQGQTATAICFGPWRQVGRGMSTEEGLGWLRDRGIWALDPAFALDALEALVSARITGTTVANMDWSRFRAVAEVQRPHPLLKRLGKARIEDADELDGDKPSASLTQLWAAPESERVQILAASIRNELAQVLKVEPGMLADDITLFEVGLDSLMAVELIKRLRHELGNISVSPQLLYEHPSISELAKILAGEMTVEDSCPDSGQKLPEPSREIHQVTIYERTYVHRRYRAGDEVGVVESLGRAFGDEVAMNLANTFDWKYLLDPQLPGRGPLLDILECDNQIVGTHGGTYVHFKIEEKTIPGAWAVDTQVDPEHRKATNWFLSNAESYRNVEPNGLDVRLSMPLPELYRYSLETGSIIDIDRFTELKFPLDMSAILRANGLNSFAAKACGLLFWPVSKAFELASKLRARNNITVCTFQRFDNRFDDFWQTVAPDYSGIMVRDYAFLSWRFDQCPNRHYTRYVVERNGEIAGYMVTRSYEWKRTQRGLIVDYLVRRNDLAVLNSLIQRAMQDFRSRGLVLVRCPISSAQREHIRQFRRNGFIIQKPGAYIVAARGPREDVMTKIDDWFFTYADSDVDYSNWEADE